MKNLTIPQTCEVMGRKTRTVQYLIADGTLRTRTIDGRRYVTASSVVAYYAAQAKAARDKYRQVKRDLAA